MPYLTEDVKKFIFPYDILLKKSKESNKTLYRHYFNYHVMHEDQLANNFQKDLYEFSKLPPKKIFEERLAFEKVIFKNKDGLHDFLNTDEVYLGITSDISPTLISMLNLIFKAIDLADTDGLLDILDDFKALVIEGKNLEKDFILILKIFNLEKVFREDMKNRIFKNYTKVLEQVQ